MNNFQKEYYEQKSFWDHGYLEDPIEKNRIEEIIKIIPDEVKTILDAGCGNGSFLNFLKKNNKYDRLTGIDFSEEALKYVQTEKIKGSISRLNFKDIEFDLITCLEVLEHLPQDDFRDTISEIQRVSRKYIIITVPNSEDIEHSLVNCPKCYCSFNPYFHLRHFDESKLKYLFDNFKPIIIKTVGPISIYKKYNKFILDLYHVFRKNPPTQTAICPQCGYQQKEQNKENNANKKFLPSAYRILKNIFKIFVPTEKKHRWLLALYVKK